MIAALTQTINPEAIPTVSRNLNLFNQTLFGFSVSLSGNVDEAVLKLEQLGQVMGTAVEKTSLEQTLSKLQDELKSSLVVISQVDTPLLESVPNLI